MFQTTLDCSPPFKFPKLESNFFKSLPNMKNITNADMVDKAKMVRFLVLNRLNLLSSKIPEDSRNFKELKLQNVVKPMILVVGIIKQSPTFQISPEDGPLRSHPLLKDASMENLSGSSLTTFYPSLAKLINGDMAERSKVRIFRFGMRRQAAIIP